MKLSALARSASSGVVADHRSVQLKEILRARWRDEIKRKSPAAREAFLSSQEGIVALGAKVCNDLLKEIELRRERVGRAVCSAAWLDAFENEGRLPPGLCFGPKTRIQCSTDGRRFSVRLQLSREETRWGDGAYAAPTCATPSRRWTPPQAVGLEDHIDRMSVDQATWDTLNWPASVSAVAIQRIELARARPIDGNW